MEATVEQQKEAVESAAENAAARKLFRYSEFVHVGEGAESCPVTEWLTTPAAEHEGETPHCENPEHFHAWIRLPNPYQHQDIREKALAAKARKLRELRDPESDASVVIDNELAQVDDPAFKEAIIDEMLAREWAEDYLQAQGEVNELEKYAHIDQDREEFHRLDEQEGSRPEAEQSSEYKALHRHIQGYLDDLEAGMKEIQEPKREELRARSLDDLVKLVRSKRVEEIGDRAFIETYNAWMWFVGAFKVELHPTLGRPYIPMWDEIGRKDKPSAGAMFSEAPEVIDALKAAFNSLQLALQKGSAGN